MRITKLQKEVFIGAYDEEFDTHEEAVVSFIRARVEDLATECLEIAPGHRAVVAKFIAAEAKRLAPLFHLIELPPEARDE